MAGLSKTDNVLITLTLRRFRAAILAVEKQRVLHVVSVCSLRYPACKAHAAYRHLWHAPLYNIFPHFSHKGRDFRKKKKVTEHKKCVLTSSTSFAWNIYHSKKKWAGYAKKIYIGLHVKCPLLFSDFNESWELWEKRDYFISLSNTYILLARKIKTCKTRVFLVAEDI